MRLGVDDDVRPARAVRRNPPDRVDPAVGDVDDDGALLPALAHAAPLEVAGIDDPGVARDDLEGVHVAERPVVVARAARSAAVQGA